MAGKSVIRMPKLKSPGTRAIAKKPLSQDYLRYKAYLKAGGVGKLAK